MNMDIIRERVCYNALLRVFREEGFSNLVLNDELSNVDEDKEFITRLFYGVLEKSVALDYIVSKLTDKVPKLPILIILKMGIYMLRYMNVADYAAVDRSVELAACLGKSGASGFVNAVLRKSKEVSLPSEKESTPLEYLSVNYGLPRWFTGLLLKQYSVKFIEGMMLFHESRTHIRLNCNNVLSFDFEKKLAKYEDLANSKTKYGYYVTRNTLNLLKKNDGLRESDFTVQSLASLMAVHKYAEGLDGSARVLDLCAAPGGKSIYLYQLLKCDITACDVHSHRLKLLEDYSRRMGADVKIELNDACVLREEWLNEFDCVICDVPCSGLGDLRSKPDVLLRRSYDDVIELTKLQSKILSVAARYVKEGGKLCYSTCSILRKENEDIVEEFLAFNDCFKLENYEGGDGYLRVFPHIDNTDGFFAASMVKSGGKV